MSDFESTSFDKLDSAGTPRSGLFFKFCRLFGKEKLHSFVNVFSEDKIPPNKGEITNLIDGNSSTIYESGTKDSSVVFYFPYHKIKIIKYSLTSEGKPTDTQQMQNWTLEGTKDNNNWIILNTREKVRDLEGIARAQVYDIKCNDFFKAFKITSIDYITLSAVEFFGYAEADSNKIDSSNHPSKITTSEPDKRKPIEESNDQNNDIKNIINQQLVNNLSQIYSKGQKPPEDKDTSESEQSSDQIILSSSKKKEEPKTSIEAFTIIKDEDNSQFTQDSTNLLQNIDSDIHIYEFPPKIVTQEEKPKEEEEEKKEEEEKNEPHEEENEIPPEDKLPLPKPEINSKDQHWMSISLTCNNYNDFYNGMFKMMKSRFSRPSSTTGFVEIFADTKKQMPLSIHNLVDCMKGTDWYSTKKENPAISLYFPFHSLSIIAIGFRSHSDKHFGPYFLKNFEIYAINDKKEIVSVGSFITNKLNDYEVKAIYQLKIPFSIRALRIVSKSGKFGLSFIELYGVGGYNEIKTQFSKDFLTNPSYYQNIKQGKLYKDYDNPHKSIKSMFVKKVKKIFDANNDDDDYVCEWSDNSDDEKKGKKKQDSLKEKKQKKPIEKPKPAVKEPKTKEIKIDHVEAIDRYGPSIIQQYEYEVDDTIQLEGPSKDSLPICSYRVKQKEIKTNSIFYFFFTNLKMKLTGIKIRVSDDVDNLPSGFNFLGHIHNEKNSKETWKLIFSSPEEKLKPNRDYYYPINTKEEFTDFVLRSYLMFKIDFIDFYGTAVVNKQTKRNAKEITEIKRYPAVLFENPPIVNASSIKKPGIFAQMKNKYGTILQGFVDFTINLPNKYITALYCSRIYYSTNSTYPGLIIHFCQHKAKITQIAITSTERDQCLNRFIIINEHNKILANEECEFGPEEKQVFDLESDSYYTYLKIFSLRGKFKCKDIELYGECTPNNIIYSPFDDKEANWNNNIVEDMKIKEINSAFDKERKNGRPENPEILFNTVNNKSYEDIISVGIKRYNGFVTFYNYGNNGYSLLHQNKDNLWMTSTTNDENSFKLLFNHHSVKLTKFGIHTPSRPGFEKYMPTDFYLFGFNSHTKRWDVLLEHLNSNPLEIMSYYTFDIKNEAKDNFYRMIQFFTLSGRVALAYITLFGYVIAENDDPPVEEAKSGDFEVLYKNMPLIVAHQIPNKYTPGIFNRAQSIFGPTLTNFVSVRLIEGKDSRYFDIWEARRDCYYSPKCNRKKAISFHFPHHIVYIEKFQIKPDSYPGLENFCIVGYMNNDDHGKILAYKRKYSMEDPDLYYWGDTKYTKTGFRIIRFFGLDDYYSFKSLDFLGIAKPTQNVLTEKEMSSSYYIPKEVTAYTSDDYY